MTNSKIIELCFLSIIYIFLVRITRVAESVKRVFCVLGMFFLWGIVPNIYSFFSLNENIWYLLCLTCVFIWFNDCLLKREIVTYKSALLIAFFCTMLGYCSHGIVASAYLLAIVVILFLDYFECKITKCAIYSIVFSLVLYNVIGVFNVRYLWVNEEGEIEKVVDIDNNLYGVGIKGEWLSEFQCLLDYIECEIKEESFVEFPCEDPVYWASNTEPQLPLFQMYRETCPLTVDEIVELIVENDITYVIIKTNCQFESYLVNEENVQEKIDNFIQYGYCVQDELGIYTILKKQ